MDGVITVTIECTNEECNMGKGTYPHFDVNDDNEVITIIRTEKISYNVPKELLINRTTEQWAANKACKNCNKKSLKVA